MYSPTPVRNISTCSAILLLVIAAQTSAQTVPTTLQDFFQPGTQPQVVQDPLFPASPGCNSCHGDFDPITAPLNRWQTSIMAQASRDPVFHAALAVAEQDAGFVGDMCLRCHTPIAWLDGRSEPTNGSALNGLGDNPQDFDGVTCHVCHRLVDPIYDPLENPTEDFDILNPFNPDDIGGMVPDVPSNAMYVVDVWDRRRGPFELQDGFFFHDFLVSPFHKEALLCATCHDVNNPAYERAGGPEPSVTDTYVLGDINAPHSNFNKYDQFPIERTFSEWSQSAFALGAVEMGGRFGGNLTAVSSCQDCHMPKTSGYACGFFEFSVHRDDLPIHNFNGSANWVLDAIVLMDADPSLAGDLHPYYVPSNIYPPLFEEAKARNVAMLQAASDMGVTANTDGITVRITNQTGHKLPSGYPEGRRMWLNVQFYDQSAVLVGEYGAYDALSGVLTAGNTKVYEARLGIDATVAQTTAQPEGESFHSALNNQWLKDNRIPPRGFTNAGFEAVQAAPVAYTYPDGQYWDDTTYSAPGCDVSSAEVRLYYQSTSKEYVEFLKNENNTNNTGDLLHDLWTMTGKSPPVEMDLVSADLDCNTNGVFDGCDISQGGSFDNNSNGIPDECECVSDINADGTVDIVDLLALLGGWGNCP